MGFRLAPKLVTLNDREWRNSPYYALVALGAHHVKVIENRRVLSAMKMYSM